MDERGAAALRIALALNSLWMLHEARPHLGALFSGGGVFPTGLSAFNTKWMAPYIFHGWYDSYDWAWCSWCGSVTVSLLLLAGIFTRTTTCLFWYMLWSTVQYRPTLHTGPHNLMIAATFWCIFIPTGQCWSLDSILWGRPHRAAKEDRPNDRLIHGAGVFAFRMQVALVYFASVAIKLYAPSTDWPSGKALELILACPAFYPTQIGLWLGKFPRICYLLTKSAGLIQVFGPMAILTPLPLIQLGGIVLLFGEHMGMLLTLNLGGFVTVSMAVLVGLLPSIFWDTLLLLGKKKPNNGAAAVAGTPPPKSSGANRAKAKKQRANGPPKEKGKGHMTDEGGPQQPEKRCSSLQRIATVLQAFFVLPLLMVVVVVVSYNVGEALQLGAMPWNQTVATEGMTHVEIRPELPWMFIAAAHLLAPVIPPEVPKNFQKIATAIHMDQRWEMFVDPSQWTCALIEIHAIAPDDEDDDGNVCIAPPGAEVSGENPKTCADRTIFKDDEDIMAMLQDFPAMAGEKPLLSHNMYWAGYMETILIQLDAVTQLIDPGQELAVLGYQAEALTRFACSKLKRHKQVKAVEMVLVTLPGLRSKEQNHEKEKEREKVGVWSKKCENATKQRGSINPVLLEGTAYSQTYYEE